MTRRTDEGSLGMAKTKKVPTFDEVLKTLGNERFDVSPATEGANRAAGAYRVSKLGCAAEVAPSTEKDAPVRLLTKGGWVRRGRADRRPRVSEVFEDQQAGDSGDGGYSAGDP
jgi:hypothetical protein